MIKLNEITILEVMHPNIFIKNKSEVEFIDMVLLIDYKVEIDEEGIREYDLDENDLGQNSLKNEFASYLMVTLDGNLYKKINEISYDELGYILRSDICPEIDDSAYDISVEEQQKAFKLICNYLKTNKFKRELNDAIEYEKGLIASNR